MEPECSLLLSPATDTFLYPESDNPIHSLQTDFFKIHFNVITHVHTTLDGTPLDE
jgi:hypothetical protein